MKCILHVGVHKTGSTAIQACLGGYDDGITRYADLDDVNHSHAFATLYTEDHHQQHWKRLGVSDDEHLTLVAGLERRMESNLMMDRDVILFSGEDISQMDSQALGRIKQHLERYCEAIDIILFVRDPLAIASSFFQESVKWMLDEVPDIISVNYMDRYTKLASVFGESNIRIYPYEGKSAYGGDMVSFFCAIAGLDEERINPVERLKNTSLSAQALKLLYLFNSTNPVSNAGPVLDQSRWEFIRLLDHLVSDKTAINQQLFAGHLDASDYTFLNDKPGLNYQIADPCAESLSDWLSDIETAAIDDIVKFLTLVGLGSDYDGNAVHVINVLYYYCVIKVYAHMVDDPGKLADKDADILRDVALKYESGVPVSRDEAIGLMSLAARARPNGLLIQSKLKEWSSV